MYFYTVLCMCAESMMVRRKWPQRVLLCCGTEWLYRMFTLQHTFWRPLVTMPIIYI
jgi:hypothetical protein